jgi:hypothetical protein
LHSYGKSLNVQRMRTSITLATLVLVISSCALLNDSTSTTEQDSGMGGSVAPTSAALTTNDDYLAPPSGYSDCGEAIPTSGWPTTVLQPLDTCIIEASAADKPSSFAIWSRDHEGGIIGTRYLVEGSDKAAIAHYHIDAEGSLTIVKTESCSQLRSDESNPFAGPVCVATQSED